MSRLENKLELGPLRISEAEIGEAVRQALTRRYPIKESESIGSYVLRHAEAEPAAIAIASGSARITYRDLVSRAADTRDVLVRAGCRGGETVAVIGGRSVETVAIFLALESLGATYVPIEQSWPQARKRTVLEHSRATYLVVHGDVGAESLAADSIGTLCESVVIPPRPKDVLAQDWDGRIGGGSVLRVSCDGSELRYLIFTSGTTGSPKGAAVEHRGLMNHLWAKVLDLELSGDDVVAFTAPLAFDISIWQMLAPLLVGGCVAVLADSDLSFPRRLCSALRSTGATVAEFVPTVVDWLVNGLRDGGGLVDLRWLISTGEELLPALAERVVDALPDVRLLNAYGPTECSDDVTHHVVSREDLQESRLPVGTPIINAALYVLCQDGDTWRAARTGEVGELFVGGVPVGAGYPDDPGATARAFFRDVLDPTSPTGRLYRTCDAALVRDGRIYCLGRLDRQVKISGVRMELGEIETVLSRHPAIRQCAVVVDDSKGPAELVAYYVAMPGAFLERDELVELFSAALPVAMVPSRLCEVEALPLSPNGKVDHTILNQRFSAPAGD